MEIRRTANAGVLLKLDGVSILMDGVCREVKPYPATPPEIKAELTANMPDAVAFTHTHKDHYDPGFAAKALQKNGVILGVSDCHGSMEPKNVGTVRITPVASRHIGIAGKYTPHASFILEGSSCVWFTGDAAPTQWRGLDLPKPDVLIVPYAYCTTTSAWAATQSLGAKAVVLVHMPTRQDDTLGLWQAVETTTGQRLLLEEKLSPQATDEVRGQKGTVQYAKSDSHCHCEEYCTLAWRSQSVGVDDHIGPDALLRLYIPNMNETLIIQLPHD